MTNSSIEAETKLVQTLELAMQDAKETGNQALMDAVALAVMTVTHIRVQAVSAIARECAEFAQDNFDGEDSDGMNHALTPASMWDGWHSKEGVDAPEMPATFADQYMYECERIGGASFRDDIAAIKGKSSPIASAADTIRDAASALLARIDNITTDEFSKGGERKEREALRDALGMVR